ncbi:hypothetical protein [Pseudomonas helleri]|uniref:Uncharacterized protein n=1 Tax=Pseudomonas helleri TaxID=1608996 RepID=A0A6A7ZGU5_9PSED|nr:hypothetical protein [Pseudomonas helleri]MQT37224.1 hypothetical protein [Pseudomonas helleri]MQU24462.1 hypothetical protein [Pseudomonas helleri]MQU43901.1 hypothetical protein [Pseudomonas helleri]MQU60567.1 hypothetical protein [Pseudomonas helleri]
MSSVDFVVGCLCGAVIVCMFVWIVLALRIAFTQMDLMLGLLRNCSFIESLAKFKQGGLWGKLLLVGSVSGVVAFSGLYVRRGTVDAEDIRRIPVHLKRRLVFLQWAGIVLISLLFLLVLVSKIFG